MHYNGCLDWNQVGDRGKMSFKANSVDVYSNGEHISVLLVLWSNDDVNFTIENKFVRTTLNNTVFDIKEVISKRSSAVNGNLNPKALKIYAQSAFQLLDHQTIASMMKQRYNHIDVQVEIDREMLGYKNIRNSLFDVILKTSDGKSHTVRQPLDSTLANVFPPRDGAHKLYTVSGDLLDPSEVVPFEELLHLDTAPIDPMILYVEYDDADYEIKLSSPLEHLIRWDKMIVNDSTSIAVVKNYILDQYCGSAEYLTVEDIKIIYFGKVANDDEIMSGLITNRENCTLHYVISEHENGQVSGGFWSDLTRGKLFEFLPKEPNPNFEADLERDRRLKERLSGSDSENVRPASLSSEQSTAQGCNEFHSVPIPTPFQTPNQSMQLDQKFRFDGESYDSVLVNGEKKYVNQQDSSTSTVEITLNTAEGYKEVVLSSSQAIINHSDPNNPYLMLSPVGLAKLKRLGVEIVPSDVVITETPDSPDLQPGGLDSQGPFGREDRGGRQQNQGFQDIPQDLPHQPDNERADGGFRFNVEVNHVLVFRGGDFLRWFNRDTLGRFFGSSTRVLYEIFKILIFYDLVIADIADKFLRILVSIIFVIYLAQTPVFIGLVRRFGRFLLPLRLRQFLDISPVSFFDSVFDRFLNNFAFQRPPTTATEQAVTILKWIVLDIVLIFTSMIPLLDTRFHSFVERKNIEELTRNEQEDDELEVDGSGEQAEEDLPGVNANHELLPNAGAERIPDEIEQLPSNGDAVATGVNAHHEH